MTFADHQSQAVEKFFERLAPLLPSYRHQTVRYLAARSDKGTFLLNLVLIVSPEKPEPVPAPYQTKNILCREVALSETGLGPRELVAALGSGSLEIAGAHLMFPPEHNGQHSAHAFPFDGAAGGRFGQVGRLVIMGDSQGYAYRQDQDFNHEVKTSAISYDSLAALGARYGLEFQDHMNFSAEIYASRVAEVSDLTRDDFQGRLRVRLASGLSPDEAVISVRSKDHPTARAHPLELSAAPVWRTAPDGGWTSEVVTVPEPEAILSVVVSYAGIAQHQREFGPQRTHINSLRVAFAAFEPDEGALAAVLANEKIRDRDPAVLERTVAALLAMRGFSIITADRIPGLQEVPDILAADAGGNILVVECTLKLPNTEEKIAKLHRRRETIRRAFAGTRQADTEVLAVLAIPQSAQTLAAYQEQAARAQILLLDRSDLTRLAEDERAANSTEIFAELRDRLSMTMLVADVGV